MELYVLCNVKRESEGECGGRRRREADSWPCISFRIKKQSLVRNTFIMSRKPEDWLVRDEISRERRAFFSSKIPRPCVSLTRSFVSRAQK